MCRPLCEKVVVNINKDSENMIVLQSTMAKSPQVIQYYQRLWIEDCMDGLWYYIILKNSPIST